MISCDEVRNALRAAGVENADQEARWMLELARRECATDAEQTARLEDWLRRRTAGEPFQYVVGSVEFYAVELAVGPGVLIPRPETELLVERALHLLAETPPGTPILDLCTGSGAIPLALAHERPDLDYTAIDLSTEALRWAVASGTGLPAAAIRLINIFPLKSISMIIQSGIRLSNRPIAVSVDSMAASCALLIPDAVLL